MPIPDISKIVLETYRVHSEVYRSLDPEEREMFSTTHATIQTLTPFGVPSVVIFHQLYKGMGAEFSSKLLGVMNKANAALDQVLPENPNAATTEQS